MPLSPALPVIFYFILSESLITLPKVKSAIVPSGARADSSLQHCHKIPKFLNNYHYILLNYNWHYYINIVSIMYLGIVYSAYAVSKCRTIFKYYIFIGALFAAPLSSVFTLFFFNKHLPK